MVFEALIDRLLAVDDQAVARLNTAVRSSAVARAIIVRAATGLAGIEVVLMVGLAMGGRRRAATRMLAAVAVVYLVSESLGSLWQRQRPFARLGTVEGLVRHPSERSFPSRHVGSGLAMAAIGRRAHPRLGLAMTVVAWSLGFSRVAAGLHYPSDVLAGALVGSGIGRYAAYT